MVSVQQARFGASRGPSVATPEVLRFKTLAVAYQDLGCCNGAQLLSLISLFVCAEAYVGVAAGGGGRGRVGQRRKIGAVGAVG